MKQKTIAKKTFGLKPGLTLLFLIACAHLPLGAPPVTGFVIPSIVMALIFIWSIAEPGNLPPWVVFSLGLIADVISSGPIGFWPLYYLTAQALAYWFARNPANSGLILSWIGFLFTTLTVTFLSWVLTTLYIMQSAPGIPMITGAAIACLGYPLIYWMSGTKYPATSSLINEQI